MPALHTISCFFNFLALIELAITQVSKTMNKAAHPPELFCPVVGPESQGYSTFHEIVTCICSHTCALFMKDGAHTVKKRCFW